MPSKEGSSRLFITPYYDGYQLTGVQEVAADGLSVISIKESHRKCKITPGSNSKQPQISCAQGIKARNSFRDLLKPDLRKVKGLECATTGSVTQLLQTHHLDNPAKSTYKKKILRILESLVTKKPKVSVQTQALTQNAVASLPDDICMLSNCQGIETKQNGSVPSHEKFSVILNEAITDSDGMVEQVENGTDNIETFSDSYHISAFTIYKTLSSPTSMRVNTSNNTLLSSEVNPGYSSSNQAVNSNIHQPSLVSSNIPLKTKKSLLDITFSKEKDIVTEHSSSSENIKRTNNNVTENKDQSLENDFTSINAEICVPAKNIDHIDNDFGSKFNTVEERDGCNNIDINISVSQDGACENPSREVVQSIFTEIFTEMQEIEDYISSYVSSFCAREEEFQNYPALTKKSSEVVSHFFEQVHSSIKVKTEQHKTNSLKTATSKEVNNTLYTSVTENVRPALMNESVNEVRGEITTDPHLEMEDSQNLTQINYSKSGNKTKPDDCQGYCYWDDDVDTLNPFSIKNTFFAQSPNDIFNTEKRNVFDKTENSLVPLNFFEDVWYELVGCISKDLFAYNTWKNVYDESILAEAKSVLDSINLFMDNECFPTPSNYNQPISNCTITEVEDSYAHLKISNLPQGLAETLNIENVRGIQDGVETRYWNSLNEISQTDVFVDNPRSNLIANDNANDIREEDLNILQDVIHLSTFNNIQSNNAIVSRNEVDDSNKISQDVEYLSERTDGIVCINPKDSLNAKMKKNNSQEYETEISRTLESFTNTNHKSKNIPGVVKNVSDVFAAQTSEPLSLSITNNEDSSMKISAFVQNTEKDLNLSSEQSTNLLFSSPHLQLNLTNPLIDYNKK